MIRYVDRHRDAGRRSNSAGDERGWTDGARQWLATGSRKLVGPGRVVLAERRSRGKQVEVGCRFPASWPGWIKMAQPQSEKRVSGLLRP